MIWIVSKSLVNSQDELSSRHLVIQEITQARVSPWSEHTVNSNGLFRIPFNFYKCVSDKGEYGIIITAHIFEVQPILQSVLNSKRALVVVNSCEIKPKVKDECLRLTKEKNAQSELYFARQELLASGNTVNFIDNVGLFGYGTTESERGLYQLRKIGLVKAIRTAYEKVINE